jgi:hypothetical protein
MYFDDFKNHLDATLNPHLLWEYNLSNFDFDEMRNGHQHFTIRFSFFTNLMRRVPVHSAFHNKYWPKIYPAP